MNTAKMLELLKNVPLNSTLFVSYIAGRKAHSNAIMSARRALMEEGIASRHFTGIYKGVSVTKKGDHVLHMWVAERDTIRPDGTKVEGAFRTFNPNLGKLLTLEVLTSAAA